MNVLDVRGRGSIPSGEDVTAGAVFCDRGCS